MTSLIQLLNIWKHYHSSSGVIIEALRDISFDIAKGEVLGLLGVNGAGKTTLSSILATFHPPTSGDILWHGKSIYKRLLSFRKKVGLCPQDAVIDQMLNLEEHLTFSGRCYGLSKKRAGEQAKKMLHQFELEPYARSYGNELSGGYRKRFLIARALVHEPELVILDEPTVGLDPHIRRQLWDIISDLRSKNVSVLLTTHYLDEAEVLSDRVCLIHAGSIRTIDTPSNLKKYHQKRNLEEVFLKFIDDPEAAIFNSLPRTEE